MPSTAMKIFCCAIILFSLVQVLTSEPARVERRPRTPPASMNAWDSFVRQRVAQVARVAHDEHKRVAAALRARRSTEWTAESIPSNIPSRLRAPAVIEDIHRRTAKKAASDHQHTAIDRVPQMTEATTDPKSSNPPPLSGGIAHDQPPRTLIQLHPMHVAVHEPIPLE